MDHHTIIRFADALKRREKAKAAILYHLADYAHVYMTDIDTLRTHIIEFAEADAEITETKAEFVATPKSSP